MECTLAPWLSRLCVVAVWLYVKLLWPLVAVVVIKTERPVSGRWQAMASSQTYSVASETEDCPRNDLPCVEMDIKQLLTHSITHSETVDLCWWSEHIQCSIVHCSVLTQTSRGCSCHRHIHIVFTWLVFHVNLSYLFASRLSFPIRPARLLGKIHFCICIIACMRRFVTRWGGHGGNEAYP